MSPKPKRPARPPIPPQSAGRIAASPFAKRRTLILTGAVAFITVAGTLIGAKLKQKAQVGEKQVVQQRTKVNLSEQIALLEATRGQLQSQKMHLEKKIGELQERQRRKQESDREKERMMAAAGREVER